MLNIYPPAALDIYRKVRISHAPAVDAACEEIFKACVGLGTDEATLVKVLGPKSANERTMIAHRFKELNNKSLRDLVQSETSGDFGYLLQLICMSLPEAEAFILNQATSGVGTTENLIYPIILGRTNEELSVLKKAFFNLYEKDLAVMLNSELSGEFHQIMMTAIQEVQIEFKQSFHTKAKAEADADALYKAGEGKWGTDEGTFVKTLLSMPPRHLANVNALYTEKYGHDLVKAIQSEFSGTSAEALVFFARANLQPFELLADHFHAAMAGIGTDESALSAALVRYHPYLARVKSIFEHKYKTPMRDTIKNETDGKFRDLLLNVIDAPVSIGNYA